jgi:hypothetical protein
LLFGQRLGDNGPDLVIAHRTHDSLFPSSHGSGDITGKIDVSS